MRKCLSFGVELEGGINHNELVKFAKYCEKYNLNLKIDRDGSVSVPDREIYNAELKMWTYYSTIYNFIIPVKALFRTYKFKTNSTCGTHIHLKFREPYHSLLVSKLSFRKYQEEFFREYKKFIETLPLDKRQKYYDRLNNAYCLARYSENAVCDQLFYDCKCSSRYYAINLNSQNLYGTIEIRIMPYAEDGDELVRMVRWVIKTLTKISNEIGEIISSININLNDLKQDYENIIQQTGAVIRCVST